MVTIAGFCYIIQEGHKYLARPGIGTLSTATRWIGGLFAWQDHQKRKPKLVELGMEQAIPVPVRTACQVMW